MGRSVVAGSIHSTVVDRAMQNIKDELHIFCINLIDNNKILNSYISEVIIKNFKRLRINIYIFVD